MNMGAVCFVRGDLDGAMQAFQNSRRGSLVTPSDRRGSLGIGRRGSLGLGRRGSLGARRGSLGLGAAVPAVDDEPEKKSVAAKLVATLLIM